MSASDSDSDDRGLDWSAPDEDRLTFPVGTLLPTSLPTGTCIGDDVSRKGSRVTRTASIQFNGAGGSPSSLVQGWCDTIKDLRIDLFALPETRIAQEATHRHIEDLFLEDGFLGISHNRPPQRALQRPTYQLLRHHHRHLLLHARRYD